MNNTQMENTILQVPIEDIIPNRFQPRLAFDDASLQDLAASIKQHGIIQPLVLRRKNDKYEIIAGERRYKAAKMAGLVSVPAIISNLDDNASAEVAIVENVQRKDLTAIEEAKSYQALLDKGYMTQEELARKMGLSQSAISNKLRLLSLDETVQEAILQGKISERHARTILKVQDHTLQRTLLNKTINERLTVKQLEEEIKKNMMNSFTTIIDEIPPVASTPNIDNMINNSIDISSINNMLNNVTSPSSSVQEESLQPEEKVNPTSFFSHNPSQVPNKFFNFLEDTAANMNVDEVMPTFDLSSIAEEPKPSDNLLNKIEDIEMLDDFEIPSLVSEISNNQEPENNYISEIIATVRNLNLESDKVKIEELNLPTEYHITIKIKKDINQN